MATKLNKKVVRETATKYRHRPIILTIEPLGSQSETRIGVRLKGTRQQYVGKLSDIFNKLAEWHGNRERAAKKEARKNGILWKHAKTKFIASNTI